MSRRQMLGWANEAALVALTVTVIVGMERLFADTTYQRDVIALAVASHVVAVAARRSGLGMIAAALLSSAALLVTVTVLLYADSAAFVLPTRHTIELLRLDLSQAWTVFSEDKAPVAVVPGFVVVSGALLWVCAFLADWAAFRLRSPLEAVAPATTVFVFTGLMGTERHQIAHGAAFAAAVGFAWLTMRVGRQMREEVWLEPAAGKGPGVSLRIGAATGSVAVLAGMLVGPALPGAGDPALLDVTDLDRGANTRRVKSPLVEVRAHLIDQADLELFSVAVDEADRDYWRLMALDEFDGNAWKQRSNFDDVAGPVRTSVDPAVATRTVAQTVTITSLSNIYVPVASELERVVDDGGVTLEYEADSGALVITREAESLARDGFTYTVESAVPVIDPGRLRTAARADVDPGFLSRYTQLPANFSQRIRDEALRITEGLTSDYDRAIALQDHLRGFEYNLNVSLDYTINGIESFLFDVQQGYCQQFASTFAAMARSLGMPTRVAVGFTWGDWDPERGEYVVRGEHAHSWPEVYLAGTGWVRFEPTPGRGAPADAAVTGLPPAQAGSEPEQLPSVTIAPGFDPGAGLPDSRSRLDELSPRDPESAPATNSPADGSGADWLTVVLVLLGLSTVIGAIPGLQRLQRRRRAVRVADDPVGRVELAWDEALRSLELMELRDRPEETPMEFAGRVRSSRRTVGPLVTLASHTTEARYAPRSDEGTVIAAERSSAEVVATCRRQATRVRLARQAFDPRRITRH
ncbi:MAG: transglutaminaseTgpA domain-containing protein [Acidimicrobiales bacterium]